MVRYIALLAFLCISSPAEELDHVTGGFGVCAAQCELLPTAQLQFQCKINGCGGLQGGYPGDYWSGGNPINPYGACAQIGGFSPSVVGCPGGTVPTNIGGSPCCVNFNLGESPYPIAGLFPPTYPTYPVYPGGRCGEPVRSSCEAQYNCAHHPERQGCQTFCRIQSGC